MRFARLAFIATAFTFALVLSSTAQAGEISYSADLSGQEEVPPVDTDGAGYADIVLDTDTMELSWTIEYSGLTGPVTAVSFHGPALQGETAGVLVRIYVGPSPMEGSAPITLDQAAQLDDGLWHLDIHTDAHPNGEIRGQVRKGGM